MVKTVLFALLAPYADWEAAYLASALRMLAPDVFEVKTVALSQEPVASIGGFRRLPDFEVDAVPEAYAALALIGGLSWRSDAALGFAPLVEGCRRQGSVLGGICGAAAFLARLGPLNHARYGQRSGRSQKVVRLRLCGRGVLYSKAGRSGQKHRHRKRHGAAGICPRDAYGAGGRAGGENPQWYDFHKLGFYTAPMPKIQKEVEVCPR